MNLALWNFCEIGRAIAGCAAIAEASMSAAALELLGKQAQQGLKGR